MARAEFTSLSDADAQADAELLLRHCAAAVIEPWTSVLALMLGDTATLAGGHRCLRLIQVALCGGNHASRMLLACRQRSMSLAVNSDSQCKHLSSHLACRLPKQGR